MFPRIQRPCPFKDNLAAVMDGDSCRICTRKVHNLNVMSEPERLAFLASCSGEVCVSYSLRPVIVATISAAAFALPAAAQEAEFYDEILVGGVTAAQIEFVADEEGTNTADMPIIYEDAVAEGASAEASASDASADLSHAVEPEETR